MEEYELGSAVTKFNPNASLSNKKYTIQKELAL